MTEKNVTVTTTGTNTSGTANVGWTFVAEMPYCQPCGMYAPPHTHRVGCDYVGCEVDGCTRTTFQHIQDAIRDMHQRTERRFREQYWREYGGQHPRPRPATGTQQMLETLGLKDDPMPTPKEVRSAFRAMIKEEHPDKGGDPVKARRIIDAYNTLRERGLAE